MQGEAKKTGELKTSVDLDIADLNRIKQTQAKQRKTQYKKISSK